MKPALNSIITLRVSIVDENGDDIPAGQDVVVLDTWDEDAILVSADNEYGEHVEAFVRPGEWYQRPSERGQG